MLAATLSLALCFVPADPFREHKRDDIEIKTDLEGSALDAAFTEVITARDAATHLFATLEVRKKSTQSLRIRLFANSADYDDFRRRTYDQQNDIHSMSFYNGQDRTIASAWEGGQPRARGELRGQVGRQVLFNHSKNPAPWLREAIFGWTEGLETDRFGDPIDFMNRERLADMRRVVESGAYCPLYELMDMREPQFYGLAGAPNNSPYPRETLYAESWSILYFLWQSKEPADIKLLAAVGERLDSGRWSQAAYQKALEELEPRWKTFVSGSLAGSPGDLRRSAWNALDRGDAREARDLAAEAVRLDDSNISGHRALAHASLAAGDWGAAIKSFAEIRKRRAADTDAAIGHARALLSRGKEKHDRVDFDDAIAAATTAAPLLPVKQRHLAYEVAAEACEAKDDAKSALKYVREARKQKGLSFEHDKQLAEWEERLLKAAISK